MRIKRLFPLLMAFVFIQTANAQTETLGSTLSTETVNSHYAIFKQYFTDPTCSELASPYSLMSDEQLQEYIGDLPKEFQAIALKAKNNTWAPREKEFRVAAYKPYSKPEEWWNGLKLTFPYSRQTNPTGITAEAGDTLLVFASAAPHYLTGRLRLLEFVNNESMPAYTHTIYEGVNMIVTQNDNVTLFVENTVYTNISNENNLLANHTPIDIHIEGGEVNGFWSKERGHTDEDWQDLLANHMKNPYIQVKGDRVIFNMSRDNLAQVCPKTITDAIGWWDLCVEWQHELMGVDKYYDRWNDMILARDGKEGMYMYATAFSTYYEDYTVKDILPWATVYANPGQMWGPAHEIGHVHQMAINIVSCTESSNNLFANVQVFRTGKTTTRGTGVAGCAQDYLDRVPFPLRGDAIGKSRMFFQLYLYFHAAGKMPDFYPRLFEALRNDPMPTSNTRDAKDDQLKFAEKCCEVAQMDLSEFFEAWGFFEPMNNANVSDYATYYVTLAKEDADASRARMQQYPKKGGHLMFIEDRIKPSERTDGVEGDRLDFNEEYAIGKMGNTGQWGDYMDESVKAEGYYYTNANGTIEIKRAGNAKGALGFKVYDAGTDRLLAFSNTYTIKIPTYAKFSDVKIVAAQADGTDYIVPDASQSDDVAWQRTALEAQLESINGILQRTTADGSQIGRFYENAVTELSDLYKSAKAAYDNNDTSEHSYREWNEMLSEEYNKLINNSKARARLEELDVYKVNNVKNRYYMCNAKYGMRAVYNTRKLENPDDMLWLVEHAGNEGEFYIKNKSGKYINGVEEIGTSCSGESKEDAIVFNVKFLDNGNAYFVTKESGLILTSGTDYDEENTALIFGANEVTDYSLWNITVKEKNNTAIENIKAEDVDNCRIYDLLGRKVEKPGRGIYIKNGKKIYIK